MSAPAPPGCVVVLAAGASRRFGLADKLLVAVAGRPLLDHTLDAVLEHVRLEDVRVVVAPDSVEVEAACERRGVQVVRSVDAARGMRWSLQAGLDAVPREDVGACVVLADDPLAAKMLPAVLEQAAADPARCVAVRRDPPVPHPVWVPRSRWPPSPSDDDDSGLRALLADCRWIDGGGAMPIDVDTLDDVDRLAAALHARGGGGDRSG